ncbi:MAG TPA: ABC transporter substrate-binding protein [Leptolyngbyaceae cyanobacterium M33_DOE_097]|uniref:ABC transporter substrate-binding protein n=1 Tax=Oscillatoriales cyanobacterium SpSt-418 TaxID=2282169 RepID=A0A7C3PLK4_9CYAN|nr:ABC transporter substrate-binding protein [Leptolyngbyaceae cyanobacterium M33_DOE_097]
MPKAHFFQRFFGFNLRGLRLILVFCLALILANCASTPTKAPDAASTGNTGSTAANTIVYGSTGQPVNLEPGNISDGNSLIAQDQIYNRLLEFKPGTSELKPALATEWSVSPDGKTWTFKLREGVKFHDGTPFDAAAVKFNVERWWDRKHPQGFRNAGKTYEIWQQIFGGFKGEPNSLLEEVVAVNPTTVQFRLKQPFAAFPNGIGAGFFGIASPEAVKQAGAAYGTPGAQAVGTGPFLFKEWVTGDRIVLDKNPNYWVKDLPKSNQAIIRFITDPAARLAQLRASRIDFTVDLSPDQKKEVESDANLKMLVRPSFNVGYLALNPSYKPLADVKVRQAIAMAINRPAIVQAFWGDLGKHDAHFTPPALAWSQAADLQPYPYDPEAAKRLLTEAGYANGFDLELWYMPVSRPYFPNPKPIAEAFAADLSTVGIRVKLQTKDWAAYLSDRRKKPGYQAFMLGWTADYGDPDSFYYAHFGPGATDDIGNWSNPQVIQLLNQARAVNDQAERARLYSTVDKILHQEVVRLPIVHSQPLLAQRTSLAGWIPSPLGSDPFEEIAKQ